VIEDIAEILRKIGHYNMRFVKPLDTLMLDKKFFTTYEHIITIEDGCKMGGFAKCYFRNLQMPTKNIQKPITIFRE